MHDIIRLIHRKEGKNMRKTININDETYSRLKDIAKQRGTTATTLINQALQGYINGHDFGKELTPLFRDMMEKMIRQGLKDGTKNTP